MKQQIGIYMIAVLLSACTATDGEPDGAGGGSGSFTLTYTIPDAEAATPTRAASYVEATAAECKVTGLHLLFFQTDVHGNGAFVGWTAATPAAASSLRQASLTATLPAGATATKDYSVLVVANLAKFFATPAAVTAYLDAFTGKTYGQAWEELQVTLTVGPDGTYSFADDCLPMSGSAVKSAGKTSLDVNLLRAIVRIDVKIWSAVTGVTLNAVQLRNVATVSPLFRTQEEISLPRAASVECTKANGKIAADNSITGGLYAVETSLDVTPPRVLMHDATCMLVSLTHTGTHTGDDATKTWYRTNLAVDASGRQFLKRNNAYTVLITGVFGPGAATPEEAYRDRATLIEAVTVPAGWETGTATPPDIIIQ